MRITMRAMVMAAVMMAGVGAAGAQIVDPSTGIMVDAGTDPMDFSNILTGQQTNAAAEISAQISAQQQAQNAQDFQNFVNSSMQAASNGNDNDDAAPAVPALPSTPKPAISPKGGTFHGSVQVTITDADAQAVVFYTTNGAKPTTSSARYAGPITVNAKEKVQALAFDLNELPSGVVSKTFKVKA